MAKRIMGVVRTGQAQGDSLPLSQANASLFDATLDGEEAHWASSYQAAGDAAIAQDDSRPVTAAQVAAIVRQVISEMKIYVLESDITEAQNAVKGVVEQTYF